MSEPMERSQQSDPDLPRQPRGKVRVWPRRWRYRVLLVCMALLLVSGSAAWLDRDRIAGDLIDNYLNQNGISASYEIVEISAQQQVIANLAVGDPDAPDFSAERVVIDIGVGLLGPMVDKVEIEQARLFGTFQDGKLSLGALDPLVFTQSEEPAGLPGIDLVIRDARALIESDFGAVGARLEGAGRLDDGFKGTLAVTAPGIGTADCRAEKATAYGALTTAKGKPEFAGPIRLAGVACAGGTFASADLGARLTAAKTLDSADGKLAVAGRELALENTRSARIGGQVAIAVSQKGVVLEHDITLDRVGLPYAAISAAAAKGTWRTGDPSANASSRSEWSGEVTANGIRLADPAMPELSAARANVGGTLLEPLIAQFADNLPRALNGSSFSAEAVIRSSEQATRLIIPDARLRSGSGEIILALSQINWGLGNAAPDGGQGNFVSAGQGLPRINGRISEEASGGFSLRLALADYMAGDSRLAVPRLTLEQTAPEAYRFSGLVTASGAIPGGQISGLELPLEGRWSQSGGLLAGTRCTDIRFEALRLAQLDLASRKIALCPDNSRAMVRYAGGLQIGATTKALTLAGAMDGAPLRLDADSLTLRYPGPLSVEGIDARLGEGSAQTRFSLASLTGSLGDTPQGEFAGASGILGELAFALSDMAGSWRFDEGRLAIDQASFTLSDRAGGQPRFEPVSAKGANLLLDGNDITARMMLHHPGSGQQLASVALRHDLASTTGRADISVNGLTFGPAMDASDLTYFVKGVVSLVEGTVTGNGRVSWTGDKVTSTGRFRTDALDFAAAFGPVRRLSGEIEFTDLLSLTTAREQQVRIGAINTGVEVLDGRITFAVTDGEIVEVKDARWPFMGGTLVMRPVRLDFGQPSEKSYVFEITGLDAEIFVTEMDFSNITATGIFDGVVPIVFDREGYGRVIDGVLRSREPGGNLSYLGDLSYTDMGAITNFAFRSLRSLDYRSMGVVLDGSLTGEIISKFEIDGVRQGEGASRNFVTRQIAKLPIQFRINVKAESFYELSTIVQSFSDVEMLGNPADRGLLRMEDGRFVPAQQPSPAPPSAPEPAKPSSSAALRHPDILVQPPESDERS